ncbi:MAG TPA: hypothetical protein VMR44_00835 [Thermoanaerobaculia bacterium]|nr:hypothetical protein [Thermoanaerobaculia bacterium]
MPPCIARDARGNHPLYALVDECYDEVKGSWEERFERRYGFWCGTIEDAVFAFLDYGIYDDFAPFFRRTVPYRVLIETDFSNGLYLSVTCAEDT